MKNKKILLSCIGGEPTLIEKITPIILWVLPAICLLFSIYYLVKGMGIKPVNVSQDLIEGTTSGRKKYIKKAIFYFVISIFSFVVLYGITQLTSSFCI
ncbi:MAG: hypothetical protein V1845_04120 [bacterium]